MLQLKQAHEYDPKKGLTLAYLAYHIWQVLSRFLCMTQRSAGKNLL